MVLCLLVQNDKSLLLILTLIKIIAESIILRKKILITVTILSINWILYLKESLKISYFYGVCLSVKPLELNFSWTKLA